MKAMWIVEQRQLMEQLIWLEWRENCHSTFIKLQNLTPNHVMGYLCDIVCESVSVGLIPSSSLGKNRENYK